MASPRASSDATPICRCRVLYLGSSVPHITKDGLQGIQEPLRELYPDQGASGARGIDSWLSVWSNGLLLENVDENHKKVTRFFPIDSLHYCAAVRYVLVQPPNSSPNTANPPRFLPLDSPFARNPNAQHPPLFAAILRRTTGIKVLECHAFICKREMAANALVKCCFHAYADASYAKQIDGGSKYSTLIKPGKAQSVLGEAASSIEKVQDWRTNTTPRTNGHGGGGGGGSGASTNGDTLRPPPQQSVEENSVAIDDVSIYNGDENHKVWAGTEYQDYSASTLRSVRSMGGLRTSRPRQIIAPAKTPPPPPPPPMEEDTSTMKKNKKLKSKGGKQLLNRSEEAMYAQQQMLYNNGHYNGNGHYMNGNGNNHLGGGGPPMHYNGTASLMRTPRGPSSVSGTLLRPMNGPPMNGYGPPPPPPHMVLVSGRHPMAPQQQPRMMAGTFSHRPKNMRPIPFLGPPPPPPMHTSTARRPMKQQHQYHHQEEPIYMPTAARPLSPVASYQPGHFPHEAYIAHAMMPPSPMMPSPYIPVEPTSLARPAKKRSKSKKEDDGSESPFNTGIYRKKGHLNERAFSYSIRQEHRSRSYGSLASLKFSEAGSPPNKEENKKEREIMQMMQDLELSGDEGPSPQHPMMNGGGGGGGMYEVSNNRPRAAAAVGRR